MSCIELICVVNDIHHVILSFLLLSYRSGTVLVEYVWDVIE